MDTAEKIRDLIAPTVADAGASLYDVEYNGGLLRITVSRPEGVDLELISTLTRAISRQLDDADPIGSGYTLEVSSPGLERTLRRPEHFAGAVGTPVTLKLRPGVEGDRRLSGVLVAADERSITVAPDPDADGADRVVPLADITRARTTFEWGPAPKPGSGSPSSKKKATKR